MIDASLINLAEFNEIVFSNLEKPYLGAYNLTDGVAIYITDKTTSCITHTLNDYEDLIKTMLKNINSSNPLVILLYGHLTKTSTLNNIQEFLSNHQIFPTHDFKIETINMTDYFNLQHQGIEFCINSHTLEIEPINYEQILEEKEKEHGRN